MSSVLSLHHQEQPGSVSFTPSHQVLMPTEEFPPEPFLNGPSSLILSLDVRHPNPLNFSGLHWSHIFPLLRIPKLDTALDVFHLC